MHRLVSARGILCCVAIIALSFGTPLMACAQCCVDISMKVSLRLSEAATSTLQVQLTNRSSEALRIKAADLPWGNRYSMILVAVQAEQPNRQISQQYSIDEPGNEVLTLAPGATLQGSISLNDYFSSLESELARGNLIAMWSYQLQTVDRKTSERLAGWFDIKRQ